MQKVAIVTGGSRGIGKAIVLELANAGYFVVFTYKSNITAAQEVLAELSRLGCNGEALQFDVADSTQSKKIMGDILTRLPGIEVLVNNAGIAADNLFALMSEEQWNTVINTTLKGFFNITKPVIRRMVKNKKGVIISIASVSAQLPNRGQANYCAAKAGLIAASRSLASEVARVGIRVNTISPGAIETEMLGEGVQREKILEIIPAARIGKPEEVAKVVRFLCSDDASYITGQNISVNGGMI